MNNFMIMEGRESISIMDQVQNLGRNKFRWENCSKQ